MGVNDEIQTADSSTAMHCYTL